jgi:hypothetical protein
MLQAQRLMPRFLNSSALQMIAAATPTHALTSTARKSFPSSPGQARQATSIVSGSENTKPGKKNAAPRKSGLAQSLVRSAWRPKPNRRKRVPITNPVSAKKEMRAPPRTVERTGTSGLYRSRNISYVYPSAMRPANVAIAPNIPAITRLAIIPMGYIPNII